MFETSPGYYQNFTWYPFLWEAGGDFQTADGKSAFNSPATVQALKFWQDADQYRRCAAQAARRRRDGTRCPTRLGLLRDAEHRHLGDRALREGAPEFQVWRLQAADAAWRQVSDDRRRLGVRRQRQGLESQGRRRVLRLGARLDESRTRSAAIVDWCTKAKSDMPPRKSALEAGKAAFENGFLKIFTDEIYPGARGPSRACRRRSTRRSPTRSRRASSTARSPQDAAAAASDQIDAFLAGYKGAPIL